MKSLWSVIPVKDLHGRLRRSPGELALERLFGAKISAMRRRRRLGPDEDDALPITPPRPGPTPLAGAAEATLEQPGERAD